MIKLVCFSLACMMALSYSNTEQSASVAVNNSIFKDSTIDGQKLFRMCGNCHGVDKEIVGPRLSQIDKRWPHKEKLYEFLKNPPLFSQKDDYAKKLLKKYQLMHPIYVLSNKQVDAIFQYVNKQSKLRRK